MTGQISSRGPSGWSLVVIVREISPKCPKHSGLGISNSNLPREHVSKQIFTFSIQIGPNYFFWGGTRSLHGTHKTFGEIKLDASVAGIILKEWVFLVSFFDDPFRGGNRNSACGWCR